MPHQRPVLLHPARAKVVACGRRWGKSALGLLACVLGHGPTRGHWRGAWDGGKVWWVAPDYPTASEIWRDLKRLCKPVWTHKDEVERRVELPSGGSVTVRSAHDPDSLVAVGLDGLVVDEAARCRPEAWYGSLRPTLSDRGGWVVFISTPKGHNWFFDLFKHAGQTPGWARWQRPSSDNPIIPREELEAARRDAPRHFEQEYEARFKSLEGAEWPSSYFDHDALWFDDWPHPIEASALALDPAQAKGERGKNCYAAFVYLALSAGILYADAWLSRQWDAAALVRQSFDLVRFCRPGCFWVETNGGQQFLADLIAAESKRRGEPIPLYGVNQHVEKQARIRGDVGPVLATRRLRLRRGSPGAELLLAQLRDFPAGEFVDGPDALQLAMQALDWLRKGGKGVGRPTVVRA